jgi:putative (di)nucleoside polyphosphate hydrolase
MCIGQKQVWFLLHFLAADDAFRLNAVDHPEFDQFRWVDFWYPVRHVIPFKRRVYVRALKHLEPLLPGREDSDDGAVGHLAPSFNKSQ